MFFVVPDSRSPSILKGKLVPSRSLAEALQSGMGAPFHPKTLLLKPERLFLPCKDLGKALKRSLGPTTLKSL